MAEAKKKPASNAAETVPRKVTVRFATEVCSAHGRFHSGDVREIDASLANAWKKAGICGEASVEKGAGHADGNA